MRLFQTWVLLVSITACLATPSRWRFDLEPRNALVNKRQETSIAITDTTIPLSTDAATPLPTDVTTSIVSDTAVLATSIGTQSTSEAFPTSSTLDLTSSTLESTVAPTTVTDQPISTSSIPLLWTQSTGSSTRPILTNTATPTAASDADVPFFKSKYHQMILAVGCLAGALLIALIVVSVIAFRARADVDLLHDRLERHEEGFDLQQRKTASLQSLSYGRLSMSDPDPDHRNSRRSYSEGGINTLPPQTKRRVSATPMGSGTPAGSRHVKFGSETGNTDESPLLRPISDHEVDAPMFAETRPLRTRGSELSGPPPPPTYAAPPPAQPAYPYSPPPQAGFLPQTSGPRPNIASGESSQMGPGGVASPSQQIRRLPPAPKTSTGSHGSYTDPFAGSNTSGH